MQKELRLFKRTLKKRISNFFAFITLGIKIGISVIIIFFVVLFLISNPSDLIKKYKANTFMQEETVSDLNHEEFVDIVTPHAKDIANTHNVRPSLLVAQAALESNWGNSLLAKESNNYFGIKDPSGEKYTTKEFEDNEEQERIATFKQYNSLHESIEDYAELLNEGTSWNSDLYSEVIQADDYKEAAYAIQDAGYATDPAYAQKVIRIIEQYQLYELDK